ncbi:hypothetical protein ANANG_G00297250, partial [Anguilla anguilla]
MILASFSTSILHIYLCTGVITGLGLALNFQPSLIMLNRYFSARRPLANGLAAAGSPVLLCCLSPLGQALQQHYGWRGLPHPGGAAAQLLRVRGADAAAG